MFIRKNRLAKRNDFKKIFQKGKKGFGYFFGVRYLDNNLDYNRYAVVASAKVSKKATVRNRLKRQARAIIKEVEDSFLIHQDVIINIMSKAVGKNYESLKTDFITMLKKNKLIK